MNAKAKTVPQKPKTSRFPKPAGRSRFTLKQIKDGWRWVWEQEKKETALHAPSSAN